MGSILFLKLLNRGVTVIGIDNHNDYCDPAIKEARSARYPGHPNYTHLRFGEGARQKGGSECIAVAARDTCADLDGLVEQFDGRHETRVQVGVARFID